MVHAKARRREGGVVVYDTPQALAKSLCAKIHEQPYGALGQSQIGEELPAMHRREPVCRFDLDNQLVSTNRSARNPSPNSIPSNSMKIGFSTPKSLGKGAGYGRRCLFAPSRLRVNKNACGLKDGCRRCNRICLLLQLRSAAPVATCVAGAGLLQAYEEVENAYRRNRRGGRHRPCQPVPDRCRRPALGPADQGIYASRRISGGFRISRPARLRPRPRCCASAP